MKDLLILVAHLLTTIAKLLGPGGARAVGADSLLMKQQIVVIHRSHHSLNGDTPAEVGVVTPKRKITLNGFSLAVLSSRALSASCGGVGAHSPRTPD